MNIRRTIPCPTCRRPVAWQESNVFRPFCSRRCKMIDLGTWADESYRIDSEEPEPHNHNTYP